MGAVFNNKRSNRISGLKRKNKRLIEQIDQEMETQSEYVMRLKKKLTRCAGKLLYAYDASTTSWTYYGGLFCGSKLCWVCNFNRQKQVRRKYRIWFKENRQLHRISNPKTGEIRTSTRAQYEKKYTHWHQTELIGYDLMHLTLTVPHCIESGHRGEKYYFESIKRAFNLVRKTDTWRAMVYGGEYGVEVGNELKNGLNIHIHALLMVKRGEKSRNRLYKFLLKEWNRSTIDTTSPHTQFTENRIEGLLKSASRLIDRQWIIENLHPQGATLITLENIYYHVDGRKVYPDQNEWDSQHLHRAVLETIKYHFEPTAFDKEGGHFNISIINELLPVMEGKSGKGLRLYERFGCLYGETQLNIKDSSQASVHEDLADALEIKMEVDESTGEILSQMPVEHEFYLLNPLKIYHDSGNEYAIQPSREALATGIRLPANSVHQAIDQMIMRMNQYKKRKS